MEWIAKMNGLFKFGQLQERAEGGRVEGTRQFGMDTNGGMNGGQREGGIVRGRGGGRGRGRGGEL